LSNLSSALCLRGLAGIHTGLFTKLSTGSVDCLAWSWIRFRPGENKRLRRAFRRVASGHNRASRSRTGVGQKIEGKALFSIIQAAGWPIFPLLLCSVVALTLIIERLSSLRTARVAPPSLLDEVLSVTRASLPPADVVNKLAQNSVLGNLMASGLRAVIADARISEDGLRQVFESAGRAAVHNMERYLNTLGTIASAAPLLGLLGTVVGMIEIFGSQAPGGGNPTLLAHGISIALYNTAFGLIIAIPSLMFYRYFRGVVDGFTLDMEQAAERLVPHLMRFSVRTPPAVAAAPAAPAATPSTPA
jgi:biopolymer transport protein ExbB